MVRKIMNYDDAVAYEIGEDFRGKVQLKKIKIWFKKLVKRNFWIQF